MKRKITCFGLSANITHQKITFASNNKKYYCTANEFYLEIENIAKYYVDAPSNTIFIEPHPDLIDVLAINIWLYGTVFAYLLQYHGYLVLHGSAIMHGNSAIIFSGNSGAGKSTLATEFVARGHTLLTDDVVAITYNDKQELVMIPGEAKVKLWSNALEYFGKSNSGLKPICNKTAKYELPISQHQTNAITIKAFFELDHQSESDEISLQKISGIERINLLIRNTYRYGMLNALKNGLKTHFEQISQLAKTIDTYTVVRPNHKYLLHELANKIINQFEDE